MSPESKSDKLFHKSDDLDLPKTVGIQQHSNLI